MTFDERFQKAKSEGMTLYQMKEGAFELSIDRFNECDQESSDEAMEDYKTLSLLCKIETDCRKLLRILKQLDKMEKDHDMIKLAVLIKNTMKMAQNNELKHEAIHPTINALDKNIKALTPSVVVEE